MYFMKKATLLLSAALCALTVLLPHVSSADKLTIKKCKDATGRWHYGDSAAAACANSKVTIMNQEGVKTSVINAPLTEAEKKQHEKEQEQAEKSKEQEKRDQLLLATYSHEADILYIRDRKVAQLESSIKASQDTLKPLRATLARLQAQADTEMKSKQAVSKQTAKSVAQTRSQIAKHEAAIAQRRKEQDAIKTQAAADLKRYRELKGESESKPATASK